MAARLEFCDDRNLDMITDIPHQIEELLPVFMNDLRLAKSGKRDVDLAARLDDLASATLPYNATLIKFRMMYQEDLRTISLLLKQCQDYLAILKNRKIHPESQIHLGIAVGMLLLIMSMVMYVYLGWSHSYEDKATLSGSRIAWHITSVISLLIAMCSSPFIGYFVGSREPTVVLSEWRELAYALKTDLLLPLLAHQAQQKKTRQECNDPSIKTLSISDPEIKQLEKYLQDLETSKLPLSVLRDKLNSLCLLLTQIKAGMIRSNHRFRMYQSSDEVVRVCGAKTEIKKMGGCN